MGTSNIVLTAVIFLAAAPFVNCDCPSVRMFGNCSFEFRCQHDISGMRMPSECLVSSNMPVSVKIILHNPAVNNETDNLDPAAVASITSFKAYGRWPQDNLDIFERMRALKELHLAGTFIERVTGQPFYRLYNLETVDVSHNRLSRIDTLFQIEFTKIRKIFMAHNALQSIPGDAFDKVTSLEELDLSHNSISNLNPDSFSNLFKLKQLKLDFNKIDSIPDYIFDNVSSLEELDLSNNSISNLNNNSFSSLPSLKILKLTNNRIVDLDGAINSLKVLKHLYLRGNQIQHIDMQSLKVIYHLETFDISANNLENIATNVLARHWSHFESHSKCKIILSENFLVSLPNAISKSLMRRDERQIEDQTYNDVQTELDLSKNSISNIEYFAFQYILQLTSLDLSHNKLTDFVVYADDLHHIKNINLSYNFIRNLNYETFAYMEHLENLDLSFNQLENVPDPNFINLRSMPRYVNMSANYIGNINSLKIKFHTKGGVLDLSSNSLSVINIPQGQTLRLLMLILRSNNIEDTSLIELSQQNELKFLDMSKNFIKELNETSLRLPPSVEYLDLTHNEIMNMTPSVFKKLGQLKTLRLSHNFLQHIEYGAFQSLNNLKDLDLSFNDIQILDSKVFTDLKSLQMLSVRHNGMYYLDYKSWIGHKNPVTVNMDGNNFDCRWLATAISDFSNGISMFRPATTEPVDSGNNLKGISCVSDAPGNLLEGLDADRTLLVMISKILEAIKEQSKLIKAQLVHENPNFQEVGAFRNEVK